MQVANIQTPIGSICLFFDRNFNLIKITRSDEFGITDKEKCPEPIRNLINFLDAYFSGRSLKIEYPINLEKLSKFDKNVLNFIKIIGFGQTVSYKWVAEILKTSPRLVGQALSRNPFPILLPCHRVIKSNGDFGGYSLGVEAKKWLINHEKTILYRLQFDKT